MVSSMLSLVNRNLHQLNLNYFTLFIVYYLCYCLLLQIPSRCKLLLTDCFFSDVNLGTLPKFLSPPPSLPFTSLCICSLPSFTHILGVPPPWFTYIQTEPENSGIGRRLLDLWWLKTTWFNKLLVEPQSIYSYLRFF